MSQILFCKERERGRKSLASLLWTQSSLNSSPTHYTHSLLWLHPFKLGHIACCLCSFTLTKKDSLMSACRQQVILKVDAAAKLFFSIQEQKKKKEKREKIKNTVAAHYHCCVPHITKWLSSPDLIEGIHKGVKSHTLICVRGEWEGKCVTLVKWNVFSKVTESSVCA